MILLNRSYPLVPEWKAPIQLVHDIETGYGDPLRVKATPDMSLRFLDESYASENASIRDIQDRMLRYYKSRDTTLSKAGLDALSNTMAGKYMFHYPIYCRHLDSES